MTQTRTGPADCGSPVLACILAVTTAEEVLRRGFDEAQRRATHLRLLVAEPAAADLDSLSELVQLWSEKYPDVARTVSARPGLDAAITLTAAARDCILVVVAEPGDARTAAVVRAATRRVHCPLVVVR
jgi:hypothetical protein